MLTHCHLHLERIDVEGENDGPLWARSSILIRLGHCAAQRCSRNDRTRQTPEETAFTASVGGSPFTIQCPPKAGRGYH